MKTNFKVGDSVYFPAFPYAEVEILSTDMGGEWPILVRWKRKNDTSAWKTAYYDYNGEPQYYTQNHRIAASPKKHTFERWFNIYEGGKESSVQWSTEEAAVNYRKVPGKNCIACIHVVQEFTEGEGL